MFDDLLILLAVVIGFFSWMPILALIANPLLFFLLNIAFLYLGYQLINIPFLGVFFVTIVVFNALFIHIFMSKKYDSNNWETISIYNPKCTHCINYTKISYKERYRIAHLQAKTDTLTLLGVNNPFISKDAKNVWKELNKIEDELGFNCAYEELKKATDRFIFTYPAKVTTIMNECNVSPRGVALIFLMNKSNKMVTSGHYHIYRGILSIAGNDLMRIWNYTAKELTTIGVYDQKEIEELRKGIMEEIKIFG